MLKIPVTKTQIAQKTVHVLVAAQVAQMTSTVVTNNTNVDPDSLVLKGGCCVAGEIVAQKTDPYTDRIVARVSERLQSWKDNRKQKKNAAE